MLKFNKAKRKRRDGAGCMPAPTSQAYILTPYLHPATPTVCCE